jgi:hypothetical protein
MLQQKANITSVRVVEYKLNEATYWSSIAKRVGGERNHGGLQYQRIQWTVF